MSSFTDYLENALIEHVFRNVAYTPPSSVYFALFTITPSDAGGGEEVSGGGYSRKEVTFGPVVEGKVLNTNNIIFSAAGGNYGTIVATGLYDASSSGNLLAWAPITPATINDLDTISFAIGSISAAMD